MAFPSNEASELAGLPRLWVFLSMTYENLLLLLAGVTHEIHPEDIFEAVTHETSGAYRKVSEEELIHMLLLYAVAVSQMV